jgi:hypothetical protein
LKVSLKVWKGGNIRKLAFIVFIIFLTMTGCNGGERDETRVLNGNSRAWNAEIEVVFTSSQEEDKYYIGGNLKFQNNYIPKKVKYYLSYPSGEGSGTSEGKNIKVLQSGGSRPGTTDKINDFAEKIILKVEWENEDEKMLKETINLD